jgi:O-methyltransferase involved in polyketide biosynthesis
MSEKIIHNLEGVPKTLLLTLYARAQESQRPDALLRDTKAVEMVSHIEADYSKLRMHRHDEVAVVIRMRKFDRHVRDFLARNPAAVVVHIGCGLDTRFERVDNGRVEWFDLDLPEVIELRQKLIETESSRYHLIPTSVFDEGWLETVRRLRPRPVMLLAEGVFLYFTEVQVCGLFRRFQEHFPGCELVCDGQTPFMIWANNLQLAVGGIKARLQWGLKTGRDPEGWAPGIRMLDEWNFFDEDEANLKALRWVRAIPALAKASGVFHYRLGE